MVRNGTSYCRMWIPCDLAPTFGRQLVVISLRTKDLTTAKSRLARKAVELEDPFIAARASSEAIWAAYTDHWMGPSDAIRTSPLERRRELTIAVVLAQRQRLDELRDADQIGPTQYLELQEDLDWKQLTVASERPARHRELDQIGMNGERKRRGGRLFCSFGSMGGRRSRAA
ncbi:hypothetical protein ASC90_02370 [Rhizobium sp. Root1220]|nr:hypothetical protein ASC90_02370 [Rhizobium sp. Root1220]